MMEHGLAFISPIGGYGFKKRIVWDEHQVLLRPPPCKKKAKMTHYRLFAQGSCRTCSQHWQSQVLLFFLLMNGWLVFWAEHSQVGRSGALLRHWEYLDKTQHCTCRAETKSRNKAKAQQVKGTSKAKSKQVTEFGPNFMTHPVLVRMSRKVGLEFSKLFVMFEMFRLAKAIASR